MKETRSPLPQSEATGTDDRYARLRELAALPIEEKVRILVKLQQRCNEVRRATGRPEMFVWQLDDSEKQ